MLPAFHDSRCLGGNLTSSNRARRWSTTDCRNRSACRGRSTKERRARSDAPYRTQLLILFGLAEQLHQLIFPQVSDRMTSMATRFIAERNHDCTAVWDTLDLALEDP